MGNAITTSVVHRMLFIALRQPRIASVLRHVFSDKPLIARMAEMIRPGGAASFSDEEHTDMKARLDDMINKASGVNVQSLVAETNALHLE